MEKLNFKININATPDKVWAILWNDTTYRQWTAVFSEDSHAVTDWKQGSKVLFLDGNDRGMVSTIVENRPYEYMSIKHLGEVINGVEDMESEKVKKWAGATENYTLKPIGNTTELYVDTDITEDFKQMFSEIWPKALQKVKELAEK